MTVKLMFIPNDDTQITLSVDYNYWLKRLNTNLNQPTNQNKLEDPKFGQPTNKKRLL